MARELVPLMSQSKGHTGYSTHGVQQLRVIYLQWFITAVVSKTSMSEPTHTSNLVSVMNIEGAKDTRNNICSHNHRELTGCSPPRPESSFRFSFHPVAQPVAETLRVVLNLKGLIKHLIEKHQVTASQRRDSTFCPRLFWGNLQRKMATG